MSPDGEDHTAETVSHDMKTPLPLIVLGLCTLFAGCARDTAAAGKDAAPAPAAKAGADCASCPDAAMMPATTHDAGALAKGFTLQQFTPIAAILATPADFEGKRLLVKGEAVAVCETRGCWVTLKDPDDNEKALRVKVEDGEIVFPMTLKGHEVVVEGVLEKVVLPEQAYRELLQKRAASKGATFDPASVTGPLVTWQLRGLGARWDS